MFLYWAKNESYHITNNWLANQVNVDIHHEEIVKYLTGIRIARFSDNHLYTNKSVLQITSGKNVKMLKLVV